MGKLHIPYTLQLPRGQGNSSTLADILEKMRKIFVSDYDGTITDKDFTRCWQSAISLRIRLIISPSTGKVGSPISRQ
jgi:hypothetical protein